MAQVALDTPLFEVLGAKSAFLKRLENLGLKNVRDLLWHFPSRYEDFSKIYPIADLEPGQQATVQGVIEEVHLGRSWRKHMSIVDATIADESGSARAVWFNQPYVANVLKVGRRANFAGKVSLSDEGELYLSHPAYEVLRTADAGTETTHTARFVPVYPETRGLTSRGLRFIMQSVMKRALPLKNGFRNRRSPSSVSRRSIRRSTRSIFPDSLRTRRRRASDSRLKTSSCCRS